MMLLVKRVLTYLLIALIRPHLSDFPAIWTHEMYVAREFDWCPVRIIGSDRFSRTPGVRWSASSRKGG